MTEAVFMMGGLGLFVGVCLAIASKVFYVYVDHPFQCIRLQWVQGKGLFIGGQGFLVLLCHVI